MNDITIVMVNYFMKDDLLIALSSLLGDSTGCPFKMQIVVVDNSANGDQIKEALAAFPTVKYIAAPGNVGFGKGNTIGFQTAPARYYFSLNPDTIIPENTRLVERFVKFMDSNPRVGAAAPKILNLDGTLQYNCYRFNLRSILVKPLKHINWDTKYAWVKKSINALLMKDFDHNHTRPVDWVLGAAMIVRAEVVKQIGWFDERYFMYFEDCDWCRAMWEHGWPVYYVHDIVIKHGHARDSAKVPGFFRAIAKNKLARVHGKSWLQYLYKWRGSHKYYGS